MVRMGLAVSVLRRKGNEITEDEERAVKLAILLHDIGHGPFSHALEYDIVCGVSHEEISSFFIEELSKEFDGQLDMALLIFQISEVSAQNVLTWNSSCIISTCII